MSSSGAAFFTVRSTAGGESRPDVLARMRVGHERLRFLMARLRQSQGCAPDRRRLFDMLCDAVEAHGAAAEHSLYAELLARTGDQRLSRRAVNVHDNAALLIDELSEMETTGEAWQAGISRIAELLEDHFRFEEAETFPLAKTLLGGEQATRLGDKYEKARHKWIEVFGREPAASQLHPVERSHFLDMAGGVAQRDGGSRGLGRPAA